MAQEFLKRDAYAGPIVKAEIVWKRFTGIAVRRWPAMTFESP
jgi:hypothetical protein